MNSLTHIKEIFKLNKFLECEGFVPRHVDLLLTSECNLQCKMCNVWKFSTKNSDLELVELSTEKIFNIIEEISALGTEYFCISGGEPLLRQDVFEIIEKAKNEGLHVNLITNGTIVTDELADRLVNSGLDEIVFSLDSAIPGPHDSIRGVSGTFKKTVRGLKALKSSKLEKKSLTPRVILNYAVSRITYQFIEEIIDLRNELGYDEILFLPLNPKTARARDLLLTYDDVNKLSLMLPSIKSRIEQNKLPSASIFPIVYICRHPDYTVQGKYSVPIRSKIKCLQSWQLATIDPFGNVYPCCFACTFQNLKDENINDVFSNDPFNMGNINQNSFNEIWNGSKYKWFRNKAKEPLAFEICHSCNYSVSRDMFFTGIFSKPSLLLRYFNELFRTSFDPNQLTYFLS